MKNVRLFHMIGSWSFVLLGMGHLVTYLFLPKTPEQEKMMQVMKDFVISMPGPDSTLLLFHEGFSLMMGLLLIGYGTANVLFAADSFDSLRSKHISMLNVLVSLLAVVLSAVYFFYCSRSVYRNFSNGICVDTRFNAAFKTDSVKARP